MPVLPIDDNYPAGAYQDNIVGRMKANGKVGNSDSFGNAALSMQGDAMDLTDPTSTASGAVQNTDYVLNQIILPALAFIKTGRGIIVRFWGTLAANANAKDLKIFVGAAGAAGTAVVTLSGTTQSGTDYFAEVCLIRTALNTFTVHAQITPNSTAAPTYANNAAVSQSETGQIVISFTARNTAAAAASGTGKGAVALFLN